ncbi:MAG: hypothetical protein J5U19_15310 [Candidatus Methanoperedens sp.]|nr:hypothetical protein [Candidatus Methanoperedens sp.]
MNNASGYIDNLNLVSNGTARLGHCILRFEGIESGGDARFSLSKYAVAFDSALNVVAAKLLRIVYWVLKISC